MEAWSVKVTTTTARVVQEDAAESRMEQDTRKMLTKEIIVPKGRKTNIPEGRKTKEKLTEKIVSEKRKKFIFNSRGKTTSKESNNNNNIFDWVLKEK